MIRTPWVALRPRIVGWRVTALEACQSAKNAGERPPTLPGLAAQPSEASP